VRDTRNWKCDWCRNAPNSIKNSKRNMKCILCPVRRGPLKATNDRRFAHVTCALYVSNTRFGDLSKLEPIIYDEQQKKSTLRSCHICNLSSGETVSCVEPGCRKRMHAMCARVTGCTMRSRPNENGGTDFVCFCRDHGDLTSCKVCKRSDRADEMLLCDGCDAEYHMRCLNPPLHSLPEHSWFCPSCAPIIAKQRDGKLYCICKQPAGDITTSVRYVQCEKCEDWFHFGCVSLKEEPKSSWWCMGCRDTS
jgi:hypothetical protein